MGDLGIPDLLALSPVFYIFVLCVGSMLRGRPEHVHLLIDHLKHLLFQQPDGIWNSTNCNNISHKLLHPDGFKYKVKHDFNKHNNINAVILSSY